MRPDLTRRRFLTETAGTVLAASTAIGSRAGAEESIQTEWTNPYKDVRGFNYQPSYEATGYAIWRNFKPEVIDREIGLGKKYFPEINTIRLWLSFDAFAVDPKQGAETFETALEILDLHGLKAMPTLFNNWHSVPDFGCISDEMLKYWYRSYGKNGTAANYVFRPYFEKIVGDHATDKRILLWDLCNEPHNNGTISLTLDWLTHTRKTCKQLGATQPIGVSVCSRLQGIKDFEPISDVLLIHPYFANKQPLGEIAEFASQKKKGVIATECCWGSLDDAARAKIVETDLGLFKKHKFGFLPHALHESRVADLHGPEYGILSSASSMEFIKMDGSLRVGHGIFNNF
jgi:hypothetical protein